MKTYAKIHSKRIPLLPIVVAGIIAIASGCLTVYKVYALHHQYELAYKQQVEANQSITVKFTDLSTQLTSLQNEDTRKTNQSLQKNITETRTVYDQAIKVYEKMSDVQSVSKDPKLNKNFALVLSQLSTLQYASAAASLTALNKQVDDAIAASQVLKGIDMASLTLAVAPPDSGYRRQKVSVGSSEYVVDIATGDLGSTKVIVDTASNESCANDCPVLSLAEYASRNGAWAAVNGSYFCPASYPTCAGKTNSFDLLVMNKNKVYFNSDNNVYSTNPAVIFMGGSVRFVGKAQEWGRDTGIDSMLSNYPLLLMNKSVQFGGNDDVKMTSNSNRAFVASKGNTVYIGVVHGVSVVGAAKVLQAMGMENAINLDSGGSTAMWANGAYKVGPGRNIPNAILFLRK
jgi:hypothetical protein